MADAKLAQVPASIQLATIKSKIHTNFDKLGKSNGTVMPPSSSNLDPIAYELFVAYELESAAKKRKERAKADALAAGVIGEDPAPGDTKICYVGSLITVALKTATPAEGLDKAALRSELTKTYGAKECDRIMAIATKKNKPAVSCIIASV